jgi:murein DD-endopeptidase MepM/ murein hydrolase activator NlpD
MTQLITLQNVPRSLGVLGLLLLTACGGKGVGRGLDWDLRGGNGLNTGGAGETLPPPAAGAGGIINYSGYQAVTANAGESVGAIAARSGQDPAEFARFNAVNVNDVMRGGEVLVLPKSTASADTAGPAALDVTQIATTALDRVGTTTLPAPLATPVANAKPAGEKGASHRVQRGETAFGIARQYNVSAKSLADWNGLGTEMSVREGQFLLIPTLNGTPPKPLEDVSAPGAGSATPTPPSALKPLPLEKTEPAAKAKAPEPAADLSADVSSPVGTFSMPVSGKIIRAYSKGKNDGIDISAGAGAAVKAAGSGTVAAVTKDTKGTPIIVIRHAGGLLTVYAGVDALTVAKGDAVKRGQTIATVRGGTNAFLHFEVRKGVESADPMGYLQ